MAEAEACRIDEVLRLTEGQRRRLVRFINMRIVDVRWWIRWGLGDAMVCRKIAQVTRSGVHQDDFQKQQRESLRGDPWYRSGYPTIGNLSLIIIIIIILAPPPPSPIFTHVTAASSFRSQSIWLWDFGIHILYLLLVVMLCFDPILLSHFTKYSIWSLFFSFKKYSLWSLCL